MRSACDSTCSYCELDHEPLNSSFLGENDRIC